MTAATTLFSIETSHGDYARGSSDTYVAALESSWFKRNGHRVIADGESKDGLYFTPANFEGASRSNENIKSINLLAFDVDHSTQDAVRKSLEKMKSDNIEFICYTTASHNPEKVVVLDEKTGEEGIRIGYRFIMHAPRNLNISEYRFAIDYVARHYGLDIDPHSRIPSQPMFYPTVYESNAEHMKCVHYRGPGNTATAVNIPDEILIDAAEEHKIISGSTNVPVLPPKGIDESYYLATVLDVVKAEGMEYNEWLETGMAIHHQTFGKGKQLWNDWSSKSSKYDPSQMHSKWQSFSENPSLKGVTLRKVLNREVSRGINNETRIIAKLIRTAETGAILDNLRVHVAEQASTGFLKGINKDIAKAYIEAKKRLYDITVTQSDAQFDLRSIDNSDKRKNFFFNNFVYIAPTSNYFELSTGIIRTGQYMDDNFTQEYGRLNNQLVPYTFRHTMRSFKDYKRPRVANDFVYSPKDSGQLVQKADGYYINVFRHTDWHVISPNDKFDPLSNPIDARVNGILNLHFDILSDSRPEVKQFLFQYLGHLRQRPGDRIYHALCITSAAQGIGKSITQALLQAVLGESNVKGLDKKTMQQANFNSYVSAKKMVQIIDEFDDLSDRRSAEILTSLKSAITSKAGPVSFKNSNDEENVPYHSSYILFSNNRNVLNGEGGRRWSHFDIRNIYPSGRGNTAGAELENLLGRNREDFFDDYVDILDNYPDRLAAFFDAVDLTDFNVNRSMVMDREKQASGAISLASVIDDTFSDMSSDKNQYVNHEIVKVSALQRKVASNYVKETGGDEVRSQRILRQEIVKFLINSGFSVAGRKKIAGLGFVSQCGPNAVYTRGDHSAIISKYNNLTPPDEEQDEHD